MMAALQYGKELFRQIQKDQVPSMAAELAYHFLLSLAPALIFTFTVLGLFGNSRQFYDQILYYAQQVMPGDALKLFDALIRNIIADSSGELAIIAILGALWMASNGATVILKALNRAYDLGEPRLNFLKQKGLSLLIVLSLGLSILIASNLIVIGDLVLAYIDQHIAGLDRTTEIGIKALRWGLVFVLLMIFTAFVYTRVPDALGRISLRQTLPGAVVFVLLWMGLSVLFSLYVSNMGRYSEVYGPLGAIVVLMIWLYLTSMALLVGAEINAMRSDVCSEDNLPANQDRKGQWRRRQA